MEVGNYIAGQWQPADSEDSIIDTNPADTRDVLAEIRSSGDVEVEAALEAATQAFPRWRGLSFPQRLEIVTQACDLLREKRDSIAQLLTRENGKTLRESEAEVEAAVTEMEFQMHHAERLGGLVAPSRRSGIHAYMVREPRGVVSVISPWNFPLNVPGRKIVPALIAGNAVVFKPASLTPLIGVEFVRLFDEAGLPPGVLNLVCGAGGQIGTKLVADPRVKAISFTGSTEVGRQIHQRAAQNLTPTQLEMGGKNAVIVLHDADLDLAVQDCTTAGFSCAGQWCTSTSRVVLERPIAGDFMERFLARVTALRVGPGMDEETDMGPVSSQAQLDRVVSYVAIGQQEGARLLCGGSQIKDPPCEHGYFFQPTVLDKVEPQMRVAQEEIFGPVVCCIEVPDLDHALEVANSVEFGLSASVYTCDLSRAQRFIDGIEAGLVHVNMHTAYKEPQLPFGGRKASGTGLPEAGETGIQFYTQHKVVYRYSDGN